LAKRIVLFTDQQQNLWQGFSGEANFPEGVRMQVASVAPEQSDVENTWIESIRVQDGLADVQTPATIIVDLRHQGESPRDVQLTLEADGAAVATRTLTLEPGEGSREVAFQHTFSAAAPQPGRPAPATVRAVLPPDRLTADDERDLVVPVVAALPVVFVDQYGSQLEDPLRNRYGETRRLRKLMAPGAGREEEHQLIQIRHVTPEELTQDVLADARLAAVAGLEDPGAMTPLLRQYVEQGGQLLLAAGGEFDPAVWSRDAWLDGDGILPAPLKPEPIGASPDEAPERIQPFSLAFDSVRNERFFDLAGVPEDELADLYSEPLFFKAVQLDLSQDVVKAIRQKAIDALRSPQASGGRQPSDDASPDSATANQPDHAGRSPADRSISTPHAPDWLVWSTPDAGEETTSVGEDDSQREAALQRLADRAAPRVVARFQNGVPFLVERRIGRGRVVFVSTGLYSAWNTMHLTNAFLVYNRLLRGLIEDTLPRRNFSTVDRIAVPLAAADRDVAIVLQRPAEKSEEMLDVGFIGQERRGVTIDNPIARGLYRLTAIPAESSAASEAAAPATRWEMPLAVAGPPQESELTRISREQFQKQAGDSLEWVSPNEDISLAGMQLHGQNWWRWLVVATLTMLLLEMAILVGTERARQA
jgi:hypothetical protein